MRLLLIGCGAMSVEYAKVLEAMNIPYDVVGRGKNNIEKFREIFPHSNIFEGGLEKNLTILKVYSHAIVATNVISLAQNVIELLQQQVRKILVEKPGFASPLEAEQVQKVYKDSSSDLYVAYNRRFLASTLKAQEIINSEGGVLSYNFEFTEWSHVIEKLVCPEVEKKYLFLANSTHVVDLAFYLGGLPVELICYRSGILPWHCSAIFSGAGKAINGALFNYSANWLSAGRWGLEVLTTESKLIFRPLEKLQVQKKGTVAINNVEMDYSLDEKFKPGFYLQVKEFMKERPEALCSFDDQMQALDIYRQISGY